MTSALPSSTSDVTFFMEEEFWIVSQLCLCLEGRACVLEQESVVRGCHSPKARRGPVR